eukprot:s2641_g4.t1
MPTPISSQSILNHHRWPVKAGEDFNDQCRSEAPQAPTQANGHYAAPANCPSDAAQDAPQEEFSNARAKWRPRGGEETIEDSLPHEPKKLSTFPINESMKSCFVWFGRTPPQRLRYARRYKWRLNCLSRQRLIGVTSCGYKQKFGS